MPRPTADEVETKKKILEHLFALELIGPGDEIKWAEDIHGHSPEPVAVLPDGRSYKRLALGGGTVQAFNEMGFSELPTQVYLCIWGRGVIVVRPHPRSGQRAYQKEVLVWKEVGTSSTPELAYIHEVHQFRPVNWLTGEDISSKE